MSLPLPLTALHRNAPSGFLKRHILAGSGGGQRFAEACPGHHGVLNRIPGLYLDASNTRSLRNGRQACLQTVQNVCRRAGRMAPGWAPCSRWPVRTLRQEGAPGRSVVLPGATAALPTCNPCLLSHGHPRGPGPETGSVDLAPVLQGIQGGPVPATRHVLRGLEGDPPVVQGVRLCAPNAGGLGSIPGQGTRSCPPQLTPSASKINKHLKKLRALQGL